MPTPRDALPEAPAGFFTFAWRLLLLATLVGAPWVFGATRPEAVYWLTLALYLVAALRGMEFITARAFRLRRPSPPPRESRWLFGIVLGLGAYGWGLVGNAVAYYDPFLLRFASLPNLFPRLPGTVDAATSAETMFTLTAMLFTIPLAAEMARERRWRRALLMTMALTGLSLALLGIAQKATHSPLLFWETERFGPYSFGMYRYHGNAGAFLNLVWPLIAGLAGQSFRSRSAYLQRSLWAPAIVFMGVAVALNVSKGAQAVAALQLLLGAFLFLRFAPRNFAADGFRWRQAAAAAAVIGLLAAGVLLLTQTAGTEMGAARWREYLARPQLDDIRLHMARACLAITRDRPWGGFGPGTFAIVFPFYSDRFSQDLWNGMWKQAHSDYLQTLLEWGICGAALWTALFLLVALRLLRRLTARLPSAPPVSLLDLAVAVSLAGIFVHALFDFPLQIASLQLYTAILLGIAVRADALPAAVRKAPPERSP